MLNSMKINGVCHESEVNFSEKREIDRSRSQVHVIT